MQSLANVTIEVVSGAIAGPSVLSQADGAFAIEMTGVTGDVVLRATKEGYSPASATVAHRSISFRGDVRVSMLLPIVPTFHIVVSVADTAFQPLADARVEILNGPRAGESATTTGGQAVFSGQFSGRLQVRATKNGFSAATGVLDLDGYPHPKQSLRLHLQPATSSANLEAGAYALTFVAAAACTALPAELRTRRYDATVTITPQAGIYFVQARGEFLDRIWGAEFRLGIAGTSARFDDDLGFWERLPPFVYFDHIGGGTATVESTTLSRIEMKYAGTFRYCSLRAARDGGCYQAPADQVIESGECFSQDHRVILERR